VQTAGLLEGGAVVAGRRESIPRPGGLAEEPEGVEVRAADPVPLDDLAAVQPRTLRVINEATARIMDALTALVADLREEKAPAERFDPRKAGVRQTGNPARKERS
jgi:hypothetical protein